MQVVWKEVLVNLQGNQAYLYAQKDKIFNALV